MSEKDAAECRQEARRRRLLAATVEQSYEGMAIADLNGYITYANQAWAEMHGYDSREELVGKHLSTFHSEEQLVNDVLPFNQVVMEQGFNRGEVGHIRKDGTPFVTRMTTTLVKDEQGDPIAITGLVLDISEQKSAERAARESHMQFQAFMNHVPGAVFIQDGEGRIRYLNRYMREMFGADESWIGKLPVDLAPEHTRKVLENLAEEVLEKGVAEREVRVETSRGMRSYDLVQFVIKREEPLPFLGGIAIDVTERKQLEEKLAQAQRMEAIGRLAGGIAHDFNNLMMVVINNADFALAALGDDDPVRSDIEDIREAGERATALTRQLLAFSRKQIMKRQVLDLNDIVKGLDTMLQRLLGEDIELAVRLALDLGPVLADASQIEQVIMNLVLNARDAMPDGGKLTIETANKDLDEPYAAVHAGVEPGPYVLLSVSDTGSGMDDSIREQIFDPFFTTKEKGKGTGLGLSTVYGIVKQSGGHVWVYSEPGQGSSFKVYLPRSADALPKPSKPAKGEQPLVQRSRTILVVEDEKSVRELATRVLEEEGHQVLAAADGLEGAKLAEAYGGPIDLLLTDVVMPRMSGKKLADMLSASRPEIKILFMSGYTENAIVHQGVLDENVLFLAKPFTARDLLLKVQSILGRD